MRRARGRGAMADWFSLMDSSTRLAFEVPQVMALRLAALAMGGPAAGIEATQMVAEKMEAAGRAGAMAAAALGSGRSDAGAAAIARMYARRVSANRRRLSGG